MNYKVENYEALEASTLNAEAKRGWFVCAAAHDGSKFVVVYNQIGGTVWDAVDLTDDQRDALLDEFGRQGLPL